MRPRAICWPGSSRRCQSGRSPRRAARGRGAALDEEALRSLYALSPAEAEVTLRLARGAAPREIAAATGRRYETVRTLLKRAMGKTGTARQADLVRCVAGHPGA